MLSFLKPKPIVVVVTETSWNSYGPKTTWSAFLNAILEKLGGINESVTPGVYHFNVTFEGFKLAVELIPFED